jgi:hypothetical protein
MKKLTDKQEKFAQLVVSLGNQSEAYRQAYDVRPTVKNETCQNNAYKLLQNNDVLTRVEEIRDKTRVSHGIDRTFIINGLLEIISDADYTFKLGKNKELSKEDRGAFFRIMQQTKNADKLKALDQLCKMLGLNEPEKIEVKDTSHKTQWG